MLDADSRRKLGRVGNAVRSGGAALAPVRNVALLLPSPDPEESVRILTECRAPPEGFDWHRHFVTHPSNGALAKLVVYAAGQAPEQTCDAAYKGLFRTAS
jgi:hypothetical protein